MTANSSSNPMNLNSRLIAFYLPQFHPIPENDEWWGKGFTEWTNTAKAKPMFRGHYQPHVPADLGFYDLRVPETRQAQADMAREYGIEAFCYYHYWFAGRQLLQRPLQEVVQSGKPDFPFCICWANSTWTGIWHGTPDRILIEQTYPGDDDHRAHFASLLPAFSDDRYVTVNGKPIFVIFDPVRIPDVRRFTDLWHEMAHRAGLKGLHIVANHGDPFWDPRPSGFDASTNTTLPQLRPWVSKRQFLRWVRKRYELMMGLPTIYTYEEAMAQLMPVAVDGFDNYPCLIHAWDNSPRSGENGLVLQNSAPGLFRILLRKALEVRSRAPLEENLIFLKSWNEWAEGNHLEPDFEFGKGYLEVIREEVSADRRSVKAARSNDVAGGLAISGSN